MREESLDDDMFYDYPSESSGGRNNLNTISRSSSNNSCPLAYGCDDFWSWNPSARSEEVVLHGAGLRVAHFHPKWSNGTAGVRGTRALNNGRFYWEICFSQRIFGTSMMIGIGTTKARLHVDGFINMIGEDRESWGLSHRGYIWHNQKKRIYTNAFQENVPTTIGIYFDGISGELSFYKDGRNLGVAFYNLHRIYEPLYPIICSTAAKTEMTLGIAKRDFFSLQDRCRDAVIHYVSQSRQIREFNIPSNLKEFILEEFNNKHYLLGL